MNCQQIPNRIVLADGFLDQPFVSQFHPGSAIALSIEPTFDVAENSGLASSTRRTAIEIWEGQLPRGNPEKLAKILFCSQLAVFMPATLRFVSPSPWRA